MSAISTAAALAPLICAAAVDDDDLVAGAQGADDLAGGPVGDLLAAFALAGGQQQAEAGVVGEDRVLEDARARCR